MVGATRIHSIRRISNQDLAAKLEQLNAQKQSLDAELILYLSELERRRLYREHACASLLAAPLRRAAKAQARDIGMPDTRTRDIGTPEAGNPGTGARTALAVPKTVAKRNRATGSGSKPRHESRKPPRAARARFRAAKSLRSKVA
ncbi:MAG TPA: hypothetical protein VIV60_32325 [Polyangiaceae bacterium]